MSILHVGASVDPVITTVAPVIASVAPVIASVAKQSPGPCARTGRLPRTPSGTRPEGRFAPRNDKATESRR